MLAGAIANLLLNGLIVVLLCVTIAYCWVLNRRIKVLQDSRGELALLLGHFDESTKRASESIIALQMASKKIGENIQFKIEKANFMLDDLAFMIEKGEKLANKMEAGFAVNRASSRVMVERPAEKPAPQKPVKIEVPEEELEAAVSSRERTAASLEAVLERVAAVRNAKTEVETPPKPERSPPMRQRSKAEQELLDMIKAGVKG